MQKLMQRKIHLWRLKTGCAHRPSQEKLSAGGRKVLQTIIGDAQQASYASAAEIALQAEVDLSTVVRAAQAMGYPGWPAWREDIRARYIGTLSLPELTNVHHAETTASEIVDQALSRNLLQLADLRKRLDRDNLVAFAKIFASASRRVIAASGSYASVGQIFAHHATIAGYRTHLVEDAVMASNTTGDLAEGDVVVALCFWRIYKSTVTAMREAKTKGAKVCLITDVRRPYLVELADHVIIVPSESTSYFVSMVPAMAVIECACAELAKLSP
ncbi:MurR/RpiR family transcriptional regulator [Rhizobium nepotum]|uniref:MurR/RpiR family transcriptional regulator n=1 Tax=Rhizobium nepotum TaxID=1035271 RepID=UPI003CF76061